MGLFYLKRGDTRPVLVVTLKNPDLTIHDLTGATAVWLHVRLSDGTVLSRQMTIDAAPTSGIVRYTWLAADWTSTPALIAGKHKMEYEVLGAAGARQTFPNNQETEDVLEADSDMADS